MLKNYLLSAWRNLKFNRLSSFINITGLAIGLTTAILLFLWINNTLNYNRFNTHYEEIYQLMKTDRGNGNVSTGSSVPCQLAGAVVANIPEVKYAARGAYSGGLFSYKDKSLDQQSIYTDPDFFRIFTYPAIEGNPGEALQNPSSVVLTESAAKRLFGNERPLGKLISLDNKYQLKVTAIIRDVPLNSSYHFDMVLPFSLFEKDNDWWKKWDDNRILTWVLLPQATQVSALNTKLTRLLKEKAHDPTLELFAYPLRDAWLRNSFSNGHPNGGRIVLLEVLGLIGIFVLLLACINFMNLATALSERRGKEVGVRKTLGAGRWQLITQFLGEALVLTTLAMALGILLARLLLPLFSRYLLHENLPFDLYSGKTWFLLMALGLTTALVAGAYPAFFLSRFHPVQVLKGVFKPGLKGGLFRKGLVVFQFFITIFLIIVTIVLLKQGQHIESRPIGYDQENLVDIDLRGPLQGRIELVRGLLLNLPGVSAVAAGSDNLVNFGAGNNGIQWPGRTADQDFYVKVSSVGYDWVKTAGLRLAKGREFDPSYGADSSACLVNEAAVRKMGLKEPLLGKKLDNSTIVGVVKDFVYNYAIDNPEPLVLYFANRGMSHLFLRIRNDEHWRETMARVEQTIRKLNPQFPFDYHFVKDEYQNQFNGMRSTVIALNWIGGLAILISCMGLFGLSTFMAERRTKEIGIRKVLGAGAPRIWYSLSLEFLQPILIAFLIAAPLAGLAMESLLSHMDYRIALSWWIFALAGLLSLAIALATVTWQGLRAARANPVKALRSE